MSKYVHKVQSFLASVHNSVLVAVSFHFHISDLSIIHCIKEHLHVEQSHVEIKQGKLIRSRHCSLMNVVHWPVKYSFRVQSLVKCLGKMRMKCILKGF